MSQFEFVTVFVSVVMALAVAELLAGLGRLIRERDRVRVYWVHVAWMVLAVLGLTQGWWHTWNARSHEFSTFFEFFALVLPGLIFVIIAFVLSPTIKEDGPFDLRAYYFHQIRWVAPMFAIELATLALTNAALGIAQVATPINAIRLVAIGLFVYLGFSANARAHAAAVVVTWGLFGLSVAILFLKNG